MESSALIRLLWPRKPGAPYGIRRLARSVSIDGLAEVARRRLPAAAAAYLEGGGEGERTLRRNREAFREFQLLPKAMRDVSDNDTATSILGSPTPLPIALGPAGGPQFIHHEGELAVVRAASAAGVPYGISTGRLDRPRGHCRRGARNAVAAAVRLG